MSTIRAAVVGTGFMGAVHTEGLRRAGVPVAGILGSSEGKGCAAAERWGIPKAYANFAQLLSDPDVGAVHLCVPNRYHAGMARAVLEADKHLLCEKPLAMMPAESAALVELGRQKPKLAAAVCYNIRFYPLCLEAREMVRRGDLGEIYHVTGSYSQDWLLLPTDYNWRVLSEEGGELRAVADIGSHWLDLTSAITGLEVSAVCADLQTVHPIRHRPGGEVETFQGKERRITETTPIPIATEDFGSILLRYGSGARGSVWVSQVSAGRKNCLRWEIAGSEASLAWDSERPNELWMGRRDEANRCLIRDPALLSPAARAATSYPGGHNEGYGDTFKQLFRAFYGAIAEGHPTELGPVATLEDGHRELLLCDAVLRSAREERWTQVG